MTEVKIKGGKPTRRVAKALAPHAADMFSRPDGTWLAVVEVSHAKRTETVETDDDVDFIARSVEVRLSSLEVAGRAEDQEALQTILTMLREQREAAGTLFDPAARADADADGGAPF